ncbi:MAG: DUF6036 family nucleotidyltransferase [Promethearchaeia archaeon]
MAEIEKVLSRLEKIFNTTKLKYVIVGGIAVIHYGHVRATQDINLIIEDNPSKISHFLNLLEVYDFGVMNKQIKKAYQERTHSSIFDEKSFLRLDIKVADKQRELEVLRNAKFKNILDCNLSIAPLEYILLGKIIYLGKIDDIPNSELMEYQDVGDFLTLFYTHKDEVDLSFLKKKTNQLGLKTTLSRLLNIDF